MAYKWKPSKSQRRAFAERMQDPEEQAAYDARKEQKAQKRRESSQFDYKTAGGSYVPTQEQFWFCAEHSEMFETMEEQTACNMVMSGYTCNDKVDHDYIHIVNEKRRAIAC